MAAAYTILGRSVPSHQLALATLGAVVFLVAPKPWGPPAPTSPSINASSPEEEKFVKEYLAKHLESKH
jgi:F-type H+-transporting ATPase subunit k